MCLAKPFPNQIKNNKQQTSKQTIRQKISTYDPRPFFCLSLSRSFFSFFSLSCALFINWINLVRSRMNKHTDTFPPVLVCES
jgi:hypothetical protein